MGTVLPLPVRCLTALRLSRRRCESVCRFLRGTLQKKKFCHKRAQSSRARSEKTMIFPIRLVEECFPYC